VTVRRLRCEPHPADAKPLSTTTSIPCGFAIAKNGPPLVPAIVSAVSTLMRVES
jgi:hypothetical protein